MFNTLPDEVLSYIMYTLSYEDLVPLFQTHKRTKLMCLDPVFWRNKIDSICPHRSNSVINKSVGVMVALYRSIEKSGYLYTFGANYYGNLGLGNTISTTEPSKVGNFDNVVQVSCSRLHNTAFLTNQGDIYTFGHNKYGELGHGHTIQRATPTKINNLKVKIKQVSCGAGHTAFVTDEGRIYTFGINYYGQLGRDIDNSQDYDPLPTPIPGFNNVIQVSCGGDHTAFITEEGSIFTFGRGQYGQLGINGSRSIPGKLNEFSDIIQVSCGESHTGFINKEGNFYVCGQIELEILAPDYKIIFPLQVPNLNHGVQISCGYQYTALVTNSGQLYMGGINFGGQLGSEDNDYRYIPRLVNLENSVIEVSCGYSHTACITKDQAVYIWGSPYGNEKLIPTRLNNFDNIIRVSCGYRFTAFIQNKFLE